MKILTIRPAFRSRVRPVGATTLIVLHATAGDGIDGSIAVLREFGYGYHFLIERDGTVHRGCPVGRQTAHAGSSYGPNEAAAGVDRRQYPNTAANRAAGRVHKFVAGCSVNAVSIGISFCNLNDGKEKITDAQWRAAVELIGLLRRQVPTLEWVTTHADVSPKRKSDPIRFPLERFANEVELKAWRMPRG
ncbi:MAG TPA: peptidoglycan recognition family protein [Fimbriimonadaceae bacterium]|nr:peptidoglycan recognition family protein [Fimbriimonadaceae bacterium]